MQRLDPKTSALIVVDIQEKLAPAMDQAAFARVVRSADLLLSAGGAGHTHGGAPPSSVVAGAGSTQLLLVLALELATALFAATLVARLRRPATART